MVFFMYMDKYLKNLQAIEKKRVELLSLEIIILVFLTVSVIVLAVLEQKYLTLFFLGLLSILFSLYIISKEKELKRLNTSLTEEQFKNIEERVRSASLQDRVKEIILLYRVGRITVSNLSLQKKLDKILYLAMKLVKAGRASIMLPNEKAGIFIIASSIGIDMNMVRVIPQKLEEGVAGWVYQNKSPLILSGNVDGDRFKNFIDKASQINSAISLPIKLKGKVIGVLNLSYTKSTDRLFTEHDLRELSLFSRYISTAIENTQLSFKKQLIHS